MTQMKTKLPRNMPRTPSMRAGRNTWQLGATADNKREAGFIHHEQGREYNPNAASDTVDADKPSAEFTPIMEAVIPVKEKVEYNAASDQVIVTEPTEDTVVAGRGWFADILESVVRIFSPASDDKELQHWPATGFSGDTATSKQKAKTGWAEIGVADPKSTTKQADDLSSKDQAA